MVVQHSGLTIVHLEPHRPVTAIPTCQTMAELRRIFAFAVINLTMSLVYEKASHRAGAGVAVLVCAPGGKVHVPVVEFQLDICERMSQVPAHHDFAGLRILGDPWDVKKLSRVVLDAGQKEDSCIVDVLIDVGKDLFRGDLV